jgi:hypothetical protein
MRYSIIFLFMILCTGCNHQHKNKPVPDTIGNRPDSTIKNEKPVAATAGKNDTALLGLSKNILAQLKSGEYDKLVPFIDPVSGIRFSPYAYVDSTSDKVLSREKFLELLKNQKEVNWGTTDGSGQPIVLSLTGYLKKYVYDKDFLIAPQSVANTFLGGGNSLNNLLQAYPGCDFTEFYFPGFDPKYEGMDWKTLRLVFKKGKDHSYLIGIVHDEWTI